MMRILLTPIPAALFAWKPFLEKVMTRLPRTVLAFLILTSMGFAQEYPASQDSRKDAALQTSRLPLARILQRTLDQSREFIEVPGAVAFVEQPDGTTWHGVSGFSDLQNMKKMTPDLKFRIASVTKTFVATMTLQLVDEQAFSLDDSLDSILPGIMPNAANVTVRQLINHTSGYFDYIQAQQPFNFLLEVSQNLTRSWTHAELLAVASANAPYFAPGAGFHYSNTNYVLLGMIIEAKAHRTLAENVETRIQQPLGLENTYMVNDLDIGMPAGSTNTYCYGDFGKGLAWTDTTFMSASWLYSTGNIISTARDLQIWLAALMSGRLLSPTSRVAMFTYVNDAYGLGVEKLGGTAEGHTGDSVMAGQAAMYQWKGWRFMILTNSAAKNPTVGFGSEYILNQFAAALLNAGFVQ
jgi:CubicO group peptidase (beta-lactamase class C family)